MQDLHLVGFTTDRRGLIFSTRAGARSGGFVVPVTDELVSVLRDLLAGDQDGSSETDPGAAPSTESDEEAAPTGADHDDERVESQLSVREIQSRIRAGEPMSDVAAAAGVPQEWIERFAPPVRAEQRRIVDRALAAHLERPRTGQSAVPLRRAVGLAMAERGVAFTAAGFDAAWSSRLVGADRWVVEFRYVQRGRSRQVSWDFDAETSTLTTSDRTASQLGFVAPEDAPGTADDRSADGLIGDPDAQPIGVGETRSPSASSRRRTASKKRAASKKAAKKAVKRTTKKAAKKKAAKKPVKKPAKKKPAKKKPVKKKPAKKAAKKKTARRATRATGKRAVKKRAAPTKATRQRATKRTPATTSAAPTPPGETSTPERAPRSETPETPETGTSGAATESPGAASEQAAAPTRPPPSGNGRVGPETGTSSPPARAHSLRVRARRADEAAGQAAGEAVVDGPAVATDADPSPDRHTGDPSHDAVGRVEARRARAAQRTSPPVQFRSGASAPVRPDGEAPRPASTGAEDDDVVEANGAARPRRRRQLRAR